MESQNVMTARERSEIDARISSEIEEAVDWVNASPMPDAATQALGVYAD
jgi:TPP-dependent pyruvate/acetoin dehydrogenase alpha subunit